MKAIFLSLLFVIPSLSYAQETARTFSTYHGDINLESLERVLSRDLRASVQDLSMRRTYNLPLRVFNNTLTGYRIFVINFTLDSSHEVSCDFTIIKSANDIMINSCKSKTADVDHRGFIPISSVGLPQITEPKVKY